MNKLTLSVRKINGGYEVQPYVDGHKLLNRRDNIGLEPQKFLSRNELLQDGELLLGICTCGCEGCDDFLVTQEIKDGIVVWETLCQYEEVTYRFDLEQYKKAIKALDRNAVHCYEKTAERIAADLLKNTSPHYGYEFEKAVASVNDRKITVFYGNGEATLSYVINWNGKYEYGEHIWYGDGTELNESGDARSNIRWFIAKVLFGNEYLLTRAYYESLYNLSHAYSNNNHKEPIIYSRLRTALLCETRKEMVVTLYYATDYIDKLIEELSCLGVSEKVIEAVECFDKYCFKDKFRDIAGPEFQRDLDIIDNPLVQKVVSAIVSESDGMPKVVLKAFDWVRENGDFENLKHCVCIALNCNTVEQRVTALLHNVFSYSNLGLEELKCKLGFNDAVLSALQCFSRNANEDDAAWVQRIAENPVAKKVKTEELRDSLYNFENKTQSEVNDNRKILRLLSGINYCA